MVWLETVFGVQKDLTWWQECARAVLIFAYGTALFRVAGRRIFGKWAALDIVVSIIIGSSLSRALTGGAPLVGTLAATTLMVGLHWLLAKGIAHWPALSKVVEGQMVVLARDGGLRREGMLQQAIGQNDLDEALRQHGLDDVSDTRLVSLEPSGRITVLKREDGGRKAPVQGGSVAR